MKIAVLQLCSFDLVEKSSDHIIEKLSEIPDPHLLDAVFLPENSLYIRISNASPEVSLSLDSPVFNPFIEWAKAHQVHILFGSNPMMHPKGTSNATVWIDPHGMMSSPYSKIHLFDVDVEGQKPVRESDQFVFGESPKVIDINDAKVGLSICYDLRFSELYLQYAKQDVDLITVPAAFLVPTGRAHWEPLLRARAIESQAFIVAAAQAGQHQGVNGAVRESYGHSLVVDPWGRVLGDLGESAGVQVFDLDLSLRKKVKAQIPMHRHRKL